MHSHHSHLGDYVSHAVGSLEEMVATARQRGFTHYCLTEHMPRYVSEFLYPEELDKNYTPQDLEQNFHNYLAHARKIQLAEEENGLSILVGFEVEGLDTYHINQAAKLKLLTDMCVGSVHFVHGIPIDFDKALWGKARDVLGSAEALYEAYFDLQYEVLTKLHPEVVGHFDLIRLFDSDVKSLDFMKANWPGVYQKILRNVKFAISYGALFELNLAAIRKSWATPYPQADICRLIISESGRFCLSDDAHSYAQIGLNYHHVWKYVTEDLGLSKIYHLAREKQKTVVVEAHVETILKLSFWDQYKQGNDQT